MENIHETFNCKSPSSIGYRIPQIYLGCWVATWHNWDEVELLNTDLSKLYFRFWKIYRKITILGKVWGRLAILIVDFQFQSKGKKNRKWKFNRQIKFFHQPFRSYSFRCKGHSPIFRLWAKTSPSSVIVIAFLVWFHAKWMILFLNWIDWIHH